MKKSFQIENLDCAHCAQKLEKIINNVPGVIKANVLFMSEKVTIEAKDEDFDNVIEEVKKAAKKQNPDWIITR